MASSIPIPEKTAVYGDANRQRYRNYRKNISDNSSIDRSNTINLRMLTYDEGMTSIQSFKSCDESMKESNEQSSIVTINVSGCRFETHLSTLENFPETLLGNARKRNAFWIKERKEYFFDRNRACFESILGYYQSNGRLHRPDTIELDEFLEEISFFELGSTARAQIVKPTILNKPKSQPMPKMKCRRVIWRLLEYPQYSMLARVIDIITIIVTVLSCVASAIETLPNIINRPVDICREQANLSLNETHVPICSAIYSSVFFIIQTICVGYFTIEFLLHLISTPSYKRYLLSLFTYVDLAAIIPYFVSLGIILSHSYIDTGRNTTLQMSILRSLRLLRILKMYRLFRHLKSLRVLGRTLKESVADFAGALCGLIIFAFLFGAAAYSAENETNREVFDSIPKATYWGIITITTVGYGDMYPITFTGRIIASLCALSGAVIIGMFVSVLVDRYQRAFNQKMDSIDQQMSSADTNDEERNILEESSSDTQQTDQQLSMRSKLNFSISMNDGNIDDHLANQIVRNLNEKIIELQQTINREIQLQIIDNDNTICTQSDTGS
ncbi:unnamed protein product [Rotaria magnacalcarata]